MIWPRHSAMSGPLRGLTLTDMGRLLSSHAEAVVGDPLVGSWTTTQLTGGPQARSANFASARVARTEAVWPCGLRPGLHVQVQTEAVRPRRGAGPSVGLRCVRRRRNLDVVEKETEPVTCLRRVCPADLPTWRSPSAVRAFEENVPGCPLWLVVVSQPKQAA